MENLNQDKDQPNVYTQEVHKKHGIPALISFFIPGVGQMIKGDIGKGILIWLFGLIGFILMFYCFYESNSDGGNASMAFLGFLCILGMMAFFIWNVYDAYNSN
ncbi:hypothetical protein [Olivibacter sitiensis]|uniref:hypothetical protein n=1 Tax=Olivibacter sitiensis TaxID=376470 RepID=UPI0003FD731D|nr:hypothetical protein [Olivibacter sitiensis]